MKNIVCLIAIISLFSSCKETITCDDFDYNTSILSYFPYETGDSIILTNTIDYDEIVIPIHEVVVEHISEHYKPSDCGGQCVDYFRINSYRDSDLHLELEFDEEDQMSFISFSLKAYPVSYSNIVDQTTYKFNGKEYSNVKLFLNKVETGQIQELVLVKDIGIVGFRDVNRIVWYIKESKLKSDNPNDIETINKTGC